MKTIGQNAGALSLLKSLFIPTLYEVGRGDTGLIQNAVRQNIKGSQIQPLTSIQWVHMTLLAAGVHDDQALSHENPEARKQQGKAWVQRFDKLISAFHNQIQVEGIEACSQAPAKRQRKRKNTGKRSTLIAIFLQCKFYVGWGKGEDLEHYVE